MKVLAFILCVFHLNNHVYSHLNNPFSVYNGEDNSDQLPNGYIRPWLHPDYEIPCIPHQFTYPGRRETVTVQIVAPSQINSAVSSSLLFASLPYGNRADRYSFNVFRFQNRNEWYYYIQESPNSNNEAWWLPQGQFIDIPIVPGPDDPIFVFTPAFTGCSLVVDYLNSATLRVYHVQRVEQYNNAQDHGRGMIRALRYSHYGYYDLNNDHIGADPFQFNYIENIAGFAYLYFDRSQSRWSLRYQAQLFEGSLMNINAPVLRNDARFEVVFPSSHRVLFASFIELDPCRTYFSPAIVRQRLFQNQQSDQQLPDAEETSFCPVQVRQRLTQLLQNNQQLPDRQEILDGFNGPRRPHNELRKKRSVRRPFYCK